ncbi:type III pantothenate kinase [Streptosporangium jomthongense]|uniref:Type III pantothenate kinase n=1 Tax=Marinobacter aromaticivorans TaxID=1494078 RepID=A0ABW2IYP7_9GAMM|nr:type III pantothenate kinase [Marinobacter aromaticivorans]GGE75289.1 type III pantothenate kinase [Streptosporangium jomthongense]
MRLLIDAGNSRLKWRLDDAGRVVDQGVGGSADPDPVPGLTTGVADISRVAVSTVASEETRLALLRHLSDRIKAPVRFYWAEAHRDGLTNAYHDCNQMGADRWHAMCGAWREHKQGFIVVDAGSAITVDYVDSGGRHLGGFILPGLQMMRRSLQVDAARIDFDPGQVLVTTPGTSTSECVNHGVAWLSGALIDRIQRDAEKFGLNDVLATGGDAGWLIQLGLAAESHPSLVLEGLAIVDAGALPE